MASQPSSASDSDDDRSPLHASNSNTLQPSPRSQQPPPRQRTRGATVRLSASLRQLTRAQIIDKLKTCPVNAQITLTFASGPLWHEETITATVVAIGEGGSRLIKSQHDTFSIPFTDDRVITLITLHSKSTLDVPINLCNGDLRHECPTIYVDGGSRPNPGSSAAAITVRTRISPIAFNDENHSRFYPLATNNIAEAIATLAGLRKAHRLLSEGTSFVNLVGDSEMIYKMTLGIAKCDDKKLLPILTQIKDIYIQIAGRVTLATMRREHGNPSDPICTKAILQARGEGDSDLFIDVPILPPVPRVQPVTPAATVAHPIGKFAVPGTLRDFANIRRFHTRSHVPDPCTHLWAMLTKHYLTLWSQAPTAEKHDACLRFLMLPHLFLPKSASNNRITRHMELAEPFHLDPTYTNAARRERQHDHNHRLSEAVTRLVNDRKLGSANQLLHNVSEADDIPFDEKVKLMKEKVLDGTFTSSIPRTTVPLITSFEVTKAVKKASKNASNAIDGWTKSLLLQAMDCDPEIANLLGVFLHWLLTDCSETTRQFFLLSRGVAIPKGRTSVRPICISSLFIKLLGSIVIERDGNPPSEMQFAIERKDGHKRIIHKIRRDMENGASVVKIDCTNAYGTLPRSVIENQLKSHDKSLQQYFRFVYGSPTKIALFGPNDPQFVTLGEGVKQGDATSSHLFCFGLDQALHMIRDAAQAQGILISIYAYMDDITITCSPEHAGQIAELAASMLRKIGLQVNEAKSSILTNTPGTLPLPRHDIQTPFVVLGANICPTVSARQEYVQQLGAKQEKYFNTLRSLPLHPQVTFTILKICGFPRIFYHCAVTPPEDMKPLTETFDHNVKRLIELIIDPSGHTVLPPTIIHSVDGAAAPCYTMHRQLIWNMTKHFALTDDPSVPRVSLITEPITTTAGAQMDHQWMLFDATHTLTPAQFATALAIHLHAMPHQLGLIGTKCNCGAIYNDAAAAEHILKCDMATSRGHTHRHNLVRDALISTARWFGITTTSEPHCFTYKDGSKKRPDVLFHTQPMGIVTDVSLLESSADLAHAETAKTTKHAEACNAQHCLFIPAVMHTRGTLGMKAESLIRTLAKAVLPAQQRSFTRHLRHAVQVAAAKGRADSLLDAAARNRW